MAKKIKNPIRTEVMLSNGELTCFLHYGLECEDCGQGGRRDYHIKELEPAEKDIAEKLTSWAIKKILAHEPDSTFEE